MKMIAEIQKTQAETQRMVAEAGKLKVEMILYPAIAAAGLLGAGAAAMAAAQRFLM